MREVPLYNMVCGPGVGVWGSGFRRDWYFIAEQPAPAPHLARPEGRAALTHIWGLGCRVRGYARAARGTAWCAVGGSGMRARASEEGSYLRLIDLCITQL